MKNFKDKLEPNWITGFTDGEGCFFLRLYKRKDRKSGWIIQTCFQIKLHIKDKDLLLQIKSFFNNVGNIIINNNYNFVVYTVSNLNEINYEIIPHFNKYPLISRKYSDYIIWKDIIEIINKRQHLTELGLYKIVSLKASLNKGLSNKLKEAFPSVMEVKKSKPDIPVKIDLNWIAGFFSGEGCFSVSIYKSNTHKIGYGIALQIIFTQHLKDELLFNSIKKTLNCGTINKFSTKNIIIFKVSKFKDVYNKMIPLFKQYHIKGIKFFNFQDFCKVAEIINNKQHYTLNGLNEIIKIKSCMNRKRIYYIS